MTVFAFKSVDFVSQKGVATKKSLPPVKAFCFFAKFTAAIFPAVSPQRGLTSIIPAPQVGSPLFKTLGGSQFPWGGAASQTKRFAKRAQAKSRDRRGRMRVSDPSRYQREDPGNGGFIRLEGQAVSRVPGSLISSLCCRGGALGTFYWRDGSGRAKCHQN